MSSAPVFLNALEPHPAAEFFPTLDSEAFAAFKADIAANGLLEPIWLCEGKVLDGRNRLRACLELGITPSFREYTGDSPIAFAWSLNAERRHLSNGQRSAIGAEMLPALEAEAHARRVATLKRGQEIPVRSELDEREDGRASIHAARIVGASATNIGYAKAIRERDPETFARVKSGELNVATAYRLMKAKTDIPPPRNQPREVRIAEIRKLAQEGNRRAQIAECLHLSEERVSELASAGEIVLPDAVLGRTPKIRAHHVIEETVSTLEGLALGLRAIDRVSFPCTAQEALEWVKSIDASLRVIHRVRKQLREHANEQ